MRARILIPILALLVIFCGVLGYAVYSNVTSATLDLVSKQIDDTLTSVENEILDAKNSSNRLTDADYEWIISGVSVTDGGVFIVDENGTVIADTQNILTKLSVSSHDWYIEAMQSSSSEFYASYGGEQVYAHGVVLDDKLIVSYISSRAVNELMITPIYVIGVVGIVFVIIMGILVYFLITRLFINPIESLDEQIGGLSQGEEIDLKPLKGCPEIVASAEELNDLIRTRAKGAGASSQGAIQQQAPKQAAVAAPEQAEPAPVQATPVPAPEPAHVPVQATPVPAPEPPTTGDLAPAPAPAHVPVQATPVPAPEPAASAPAPASAPPTTGELTPAPAPETRFEFAGALREIFEQYRSVVVAKKLNFSLFVDNKMPQMIYDNKTAMMACISDFFDRAFAEAVMDSTVKAHVALTSLDQADNDKDIAFIINVHYNGREEKVLLKAKRG